MATELKHTVKPSGGDFTTLSAAVDHIEAAHGNLVTADVYATIEIDGTWSSADTTAVTVHNITTDATHYLRIYTTAAARHQGVWSSSYYQLITSNATAITSTSVSNVYYDGLQIGHSSESANFQNCIYFSGSVTATTNRLVVSNTITRCANNNSYRVPSIQCECANQLVYAYNWIDYGHGTDANNYNCGFFIGNGAATIYSSTVIGGYVGIYRGGGAITAKNTYAYGSSAAWLGVGASLTMTNCSGNDTTPEDTAPLDSVANGTDTFVNVTYATADFHLAADGLSPLQGAGVDTSGDGAPMNFTVDIDGQTRDATWDIGADAWYVAPATGMENDIMMIFEC